MFIRFLMINNDMSRGDPHSMLPWRIPGATPHYGQFFTGE